MAFQPRKAKLVTNSKGVKFFIASFAESVTDMASADFPNLLRMLNQNRHDNCAERYSDV